MLVRASNPGAIAPSPGAPRRAETETAPSVDRFESSAPQLMVGVPTGFLSPQIPPPTNITANVGIEIAPGLGISLDGRALLVGHKETLENLKIVGHLQDGTMPQRDFQVHHNGASSDVDGHFDWQDYHMTQNGATLNVQGQTDRETFQSHPTSDGFAVVSHYSGRSYDVHEHANVARVTCGYPQGDNYTITQNGNVTTVDTGHAENSFTLTRNGDGSMDVKGPLNPQDFHITANGSNVDIRGYYPQQHFVVTAA